MFTNIRSIVHSALKDQSFFPWLRFGNYPTDMRLQQLSQRCFFGMSTTTFFQIVLLAFFFTALAGSTNLSSKSPNCNVNYNFYAGPNSKKIENILSLVQQQLARLEQEMNALKGNQKCTKQNVFKSCAEAYKSGRNISGVYKINPDSLGEFEVFCDQTTAGGGWTVFQKRFNGSVDFFRDWNEYKRGFGNVRGEFWLGLDKIHRLTANSSKKLRVDLKDFHGKTTFAEYSSFSVAGERAKYLLSLGRYSGTAGDSFSYHSGAAFSTKDRDNDAYSRSCASAHKGGWWYKHCHYANLNGLYLKGIVDSKGVCWYHWKRRYESLKRSEMKIRQKDF